MLIPEAPESARVRYGRVGGKTPRVVRAASRCRGCGAYTQPRNNKGDAYAYCKGCHPGRDQAAPDARARSRGDARLARHAPVQAALVPCVLRPQVEHGGSGFPAGSRRPISQPQDGRR
jgi:hypothetical protein